MKSIYVGWSKKNFSICHSGLLNDMMSIFHYFCGWWKWSLIAACFRASFPDNIHTVQLKMTVFFGLFMLFIAEFLYLFIFFDVTDPVSVSNQVQFFFSNFLFLMLLFS